MYYVIRVTGCLDMGRHYKRTTSRASYPNEAMMSALNDIRQSKLNVCKASQVYGIPRATIIKWMKQPEIINQPT